MAFVTLVQGTYESGPGDKSGTEVFAKRYTSLLKTGGVQATFYAVSEGELLVTEDNGYMGDVKAFALDQPDVARFRWKDHDYYPDGPRRPIAPVSTSGTPSPTDSPTPTPTPTAEEL